MSGYPVVMVEKGAERIETAERLSILKKIRGDQTQRKTTTTLFLLNHVKIGQLLNKPFWFNQHLVIFDKSFSEIYEKTFTRNTFVVFLGAFRC